MAIRKQSAHANSISINRVFFLGKAEIRTGTYIDKVDGKKNIIFSALHKRYNVQSLHHQVTRPHWYYPSPIIAHG